MAPKSPIARGRKPLGAVRAIAKWVFLLGLCHATGTAWHEVMGHGLVGVLCGGEIRRVEVLTIQFYPMPAYMGWDGQFGQCSVEGIETPRGAGF